MSVKDLFDEAANIERVKEEHQKSLIMCLEKIRQWQKYKVDFETLELRLKTLPDKVAHDILVPFGSQAFIPGNLIHTNEVTVLLGDNWFAQVSAKQACEIAKRRMKQCEDMLESLEKEKQQFENWLGYIYDASDQGLVEIKEEYDPEREKAWREQHTKNVREYHKKLLKESKDHVTVLSVVVFDEKGDRRKSDDYYAERLNQLEVTEENDWSNITGSESELSDESEEMDDEVEQQEGQDFKPDESIQIHAESMNKLKEVATACQPHANSAVDNQKDGKLDRLYSSDVIHNNSCDKHVRWSDLSEAKSKCITFKHSLFKNHQYHPKQKNNHRKRGKRRRRNSSTSDFEEDESGEKTPPVINSPSDIYKCFSFSIQQAKPKSILKSNNNSSFDNEVLSSSSNSTLPVKLDEIGPSQTSNCIEVGPLLSNREAVDELSTSNEVNHQLSNGLHSAQSDLTNANFKNSMLVFHNDEDEELSRNTESLTISPHDHKTMAFTGEIRECSEKSLKQEHSGSRPKSFFKSSRSESKKL